MMWPLPDELSRRDTLMLHELFHRIQDKLPFAPMRNASNAHLDTLDGRYTMLLEYRALARALNASDDNERRAAIADALLFRADRHHLFLRAAADEKTLEMNEGLAEYTGVRLGNPQPGEAQAAALRDLNNQAKVPSLVRSFAYATGPAYGLLLDRCRPDWRTALQSGQTLPELLQSALKVSLPADLEQATQQQAARYDGIALHATESEREKKRQARLTLYRAQFIDGPSLSIPLQKMSVQFDPRTLQPLDDLGTVYPEIRISDVWVFSRPRRVRWSRESGAPSSSLLPPQPPAAQSKVTAGRSNSSPAGSWPPRPAKATTCCNPHNSFIQSGDLRAGALKQHANACSTVLLSVLAVAAFRSHSSACSTAAVAGVKRIFQDRSSE